MQFKPVKTNGWIGKTALQRRIPRGIVVFDSSHRGLCPVIEPCASSNGAQQAAKRTNSVEKLVGSVGADSGNRVDQLA